MTCWNKNRHDIEPNCLKHCTLLLVWVQNLDGYRILSGCGEGTSNTSLYIRRDVEEECDKKEQSLGGWREVGGRLEGGWREVVVSRRSEGLDDGR